VTVGFLDDYPNVEVRRSARRKRTVAAQREGDKIIILAPQRITDRELDSIARGLVTRLDKRQSLQRSDDELERRAHELTKIYLGTTLSILCPAGVSIRWVTNQNTRWGSCTPTQGTIRISHRLQGVPDYVLDAVLLHELVHLIESGHNPRFYSFMDRYPEHEKANAFLAGFLHGQKSQVPFEAQEDES
jgi:predicted metal-dependent hydrolase